MTGDLASDDRYTVIRGGLVLDTERMEASKQDIYVRRGTVEILLPHGAEGPADAVEIDATDRLLIPGLINTHTHGHGSLGRGRGDLWTLELLLNAGPWISGKRTLEDKRLAAQLNAAELVLKGCTACYDLYFEFPTPSVEGISAVADGYGDVGMRAVIAPMVADRSLYEAIPGLIDSLPVELQREVERLGLDPYETTIQAYQVLLDSWHQDRDFAAPAIAPTIPQHCTEPFLLTCRDLAKDYGVGLHMHLAESKLQAQAGQALYGCTQTAYLDRLGLLGPNFIGAHCVWIDDDDIQRIADRGAAITHQPGCNLHIGSGIAPTRKFLDAGIAVGMAPTAPMPQTIKTCSTPFAWRPMSRASWRRNPTAGCQRRRLSQWRPRAVPVCWGLTGALDVSPPGILPISSFWTSGV